MKGLLTKDFRLLLVRKRFFLILVPIALLLEFNQPGFAPMWLAFISLFFAISTFSYDEYDNCYPFLLSLPASRRTYVLEKYIYTLSICIGSLAVGTLLGLLAAAVQRRGDMAQLLYSSAVYVPVIIILLSVMFPPIVKLGSEKGRLILAAALMVSGVVAYAALQTVQAMGVDLTETLLDILQKMGKNTDAAILVLLLLLAAALLAASIAASSRIMEKREF